MRQRYRELSLDLCWQAIEKCYQGKWGRNDVLTDIEEWTGWSRNQIREYELENPEHKYRLMYEIMEERAQALHDMIEDIRLGADPDFDPVSTRRRADGATGKMRNIAYLCIRMQLLGHCLQLGLEPLLEARILPCQFASLPGRGPAKLVRSVRRILRKRYKVKFFTKSDCRNAYGSTKYRILREIIRKEIPKAEWIHKGMAIMEQYAPGGNLIIGGFLDAWLFNLVMSYALREAMATAGKRRNRTVRMMTGCADYMDDVVYMGKSRKGLKAVFRRCAAYLETTFGIGTKQTAGYIRILNAEEEKRRKGKARPAARGCPAIDVAGYRISRTHTRMRGRNARRTRRCFLRAEREYRKTGTIRRQRAAQVISRNGIITGADSFRFMEKYLVVKLRRMARKVMGYWGRIETKKRKEILQDAVEKYRKHRKALEGMRWRAPGGRAAYPAGG